tara:strand:+ start:212 stop:1252 length:1041 start_codon:yes stop_codon:yes gene_type:complete
LQYNLFKETSDIDYHFLEVSNNLSDYEEEYVIQIVFDYFRRKGFPHYEIEEGEKLYQMDKLIRFNQLSLLDGDKINQSMHSLRLAWSYFPHFWGVRCGNSKYTPLEIFEDDSLFKKTIRQAYKFCVKYENNKMSISRIRQSLKVYNGTQVVSNFRPSAAKLIYDLFNTNGVVWDMSCGWGGRLLGALSNFKIKTYIGTEPSTKTYQGLINIKKDFNHIKNIEIFKIGSEDYLPDKNSLGLCFTSPPYFDTEKYSNEDTQSYIKYPSEDGWLNGFMRDTLMNCHYGLKPGGYLVLNIANTKSAKNIEEGLLSLAKGTGFKHTRTMQLVLSSISGAGYKYEPVYVFKK